MSGEHVAPSRSIDGQPTPRKRGCLQFRLWHLLVLTLIISVACTIIALPDVVASSAIGVTTIQVLVVLIVSAVYAQGYTRAFCIGALIPTCLVAVVVVMMFSTLTWDLGRTTETDTLLPTPTVEVGWPGERG